MVQKETNQLKQIQYYGEFVCPCLVFTGVESLFFETPGVSQVASQVDDIPTAEHKPPACHG